MTHPNHMLDLADVVVSQHEHLSIPSRIEWVQKAIDYLLPRTETWGICDTDRLSRLSIVLTEVLTNAIVHGNMGISSHLKEEGDAFAKALARCSSQSEITDKPVDIRVHYDGQSCIWTITDQGNGFDASTLLKQLNEDDPDTELLSGRGILLIQAFVDEVSWAQNGRQIQFILHKPGHEQRQEPRTQTSTSIRVAPLGSNNAIDWETAFDSVAMDLSTGGIRLMHPPLDTATRIMIEMQTDEGHIYLPAEVCRTAELDDEIAQIGCRFLTPDVSEQSTYATLEQQAQALEELMASLEILDDIEDDKEARQRQHTRVVFTEPIAVDSLDGSPTQQAVARDLSKGGLAFISQFKPQIGARVGITLKSSLKILGIVTRCSRLAGQHFDIGIRFL